MNLQKMLRDLGFPNPDHISKSLGDEKILSLLDTMLRNIDPLSVLVWKMYYGIGHPDMSAEELGGLLAPPLSVGQVYTVKKRVKQKLMYRDRIQILASVVKELPPPT